MATGNLQSVNDMT